MWLPAPQAKTSLFAFSQSAAGRLDTFRIERRLGQPNGVVVVLPV